MAPVTIADVSAVISEVAEELRAAGKQTLAAKLIAAGAGIAVGHDAAVVRALVSGLTHECRAASEILAAALSVLTTEQKHELAQKVDARGLVGPSQGTTRQHERAGIVVRAERFLYVTNPPGALH